MWVSVLCVVWLQCLDLSLQIMIELYLPGLVLVSVHHFGYLIRVFRIKMFLYCVTRLLLLMYCLMYCCSVSESLCDYLIPRVNILI